MQFSIVKTMQLMLLVYKFDKINKTEDLFGNKRLESLYKTNNFEQVV